MSSSRHERVSELFLRASELDAEQRDAFLGSECAGDPELRAEVESLLARDREEREHPQAGGATGRLRERLPAFLDPSTPLPHPARIGPYRIVDVLGEGGMGIVYLAEQDQPIRRRVALKLVKLETREVLTRFESERQALALMNHPNIARVYDAGATDEGRPYFVMEYIDGIPFTSYCDHYRLGIRERIELFLQVCNGVQHAHHKGIIHRDIKPSNVLVKIQDDLPVPKIIDFGVAKATAVQRLSRTTMFTHLGVLIGTPEYVSPEQAATGVADVDTRTDVYSLGVLIYETLTGCLPFDLKDLPDAGFDTIRKKICDEEPPTPSARVTRLGAAVGESAHCRRTDPGALARQLRGDLDWIAGKALEKDRTRRYASPSELAEDLGRYLRGEPVLAGPPSALYRAMKFLRRHRLGAAAASLVLMTLMIGIAGTTLGLVRARRAERAARAAQAMATEEADRATLEAAKTEQILEFLVGLFEVSDPYRGRGATITVREILEHGASNVYRELADQPLARARLLGTIGGVYRRLGLFEEARPLLEDALETRTNELGPEHLDVAASKLELAWVLCLTGELDRARALAEDALHLREQALGPRHPDVAWSLIRLGEVHHRLGNLDRARPIYERALAIQEEALAPHDASLGWVLNALGHVEYLAGDLDDAQSMYQRALTIQRHALGDDHSKVAWTLRNLADVHAKRGQPAKAREMYEEVLAIQERTLGSGHPDMYATLWNLARFQVAAGDLARAESLFQRANAIVERLQGSESAQLAYDRACVAAMLGRRGEALNWLTRAVRAGWTDADWMADDDELVALRGDPEFERIVARLRESTSP
jgi:serine/threonine protein kinase/Tfp pilus assembly protein PilF